MERRARYETDGCATLPNPLPRGARAAWIEGAAENTAAFQSAGYDYSRTHASFLWKLDGAETFLNGCEEREVRGGAMRMRSWTGKNCVAEDPNNAFGCYWRYDAQAFEGCGCVVAAAATCLCDRVADVTVSEYKIDTVSLDELTSLSTGDVLNTWRVLAVVGGMFFGSLLLASALHLRATLGKRRLLRCVLLYKNILLTHRSVSTFDRVGPFQLTGELFLYGMALISRRSSRGRGMDESDRVLAGPV